MIKKTLITLLSILAISSAMLPRTMSLNPNVLTPDPELHPYTSREDIKLPSLDASGPAVTINNCRFGNADFNPLRRDNS